MTLTFKLDLDIFPLYLHTEIQVHVCSFGDVKAITPFADAGCNKSNSYISFAIKAKITVESSTITNMVLCTDLVSAYAGQMKGQTYLQLYNTSALIVQSHDDRGVGVLIVWGRPLLIWGRVRRKSSFYPLWSRR